MAPQQETKLYFNKLNTRTIAQNKWGKILISGCVIELILPENQSIIQVWAVYEATKID